MRGRSVQRRNTQVRSCGVRWFPGSSKLLYALRLLFRRIEEALSPIPSSNQYCNIGIIKSQRVPLLKANEGSLS